MTQSERPAARDPNAALAELEEPTFQWRLVGLVVGALVVAWFVGALFTQWWGPWAFLLPGVLTVAAAGGALYLWRLASRSRGIVRILKSATDEAGRQAALETLKGKAEAGDVMSAFAQAQLLMQTDPAEAMRVMEAIDLGKVPAIAQQEVRASRVLMSLLHNRVEDASRVVEGMRIEQAVQPKIKVMCAAVMAETYARTGRAEEAAKLLQTYSPDDTSYGDESRALLYRAQVYASMGLKKRGLAKAAMQRLSKLDPNMVAAFAVKGKNPELAKMAKDLLVQSGAVPRPKMRVIR